MANHGTLPASRFSTATSVTSFSTTSRGILPQYNYALIAKLQGLPIHTPPGPCPIHASTRPLTKTKLHTKRKAKKEVKAKAAKDRTLAVAAKHAESLARKQEKQELQLSAAEAKAAKAVAKSDELRAVAAKTSVLTTEPVTPHLHKKSKGIARAPSPCSAGSLIHQQSPQQKTIFANKRVSVHSPLCFPVSQQTTPGELLLPEGSYSSDSSGDILVISNDTSGDTNNDNKPISLISTSCRDIIFPNKRSVACGGCCYGSPLSKDCVSLKAPPGKAYSWPKETLDASYFSGLWTNNVDDVNMSLESDTLVGSSSPCTVKLTTLFGMERFASTPWSNREEADILDGLWLGSHNITWLTHLVSCHFAGDWLAYLHFLHWVDTQSLERPGSEICLDEWLSLKFPSANNSNEKNKLDYGNGILAYNQLCNKTVINVIDSSQFNGTGTPPASWRKNKTPPGSSSSRHSDIHTMFLAIWARTPHDLAAAQMMETNIALQEADKQASLD
jgi:hypothetical protein